jgi:hypothetical protein
MSDFLLQVFSEFLKAVPIVVFSLKAIASVAGAIVAIHGFFRWYRRFHRKKHTTKNNTQSQEKQEELQLLNSQIENSPPEEVTHQYQFERKEDGKVLRPNDK